LSSVPIKRIAEHANEWEADAILVAGDVFDANEVSDTTLRKTLNQMQGLAWPCHRFREATEPYSKHQAASG